MPLQSKLGCFCLAMLLMLLTAAHSQAAVETENVRSFKSAGSPVDTALSGDGQFFFVLTAQGSVEVYTAKGDLKDSITLTSPADRIISSDSGEILYLSDSASGGIKILEVNYVQQINTKGSPFKGPQSAPVTIAIFSDFQ